jgi:hypothetical protein
MRRPDWWNWPPFMTVRRHNRILADVIAEAQKVIDSEYERATRAGRAQVHAWAREDTWDLFHGGREFGEDPRRQASSNNALQRAEHEFAPERTNLKEALDATEATAG